LKLKSRVASQLRLAAFLPYRLNVLATLVSEGLAQIYQSRLGIGIPEWRVLATLGEFGQMTATAIGQHAHMRKVKVSRAIAALDGRCLLMRTPNRDDRREAFVALTPEGEATYAAIAPLAVGFAASLTEGLSPAELAQLNALLDRLTERAAVLNQRPTG
jgi:DNA-binding MarR family transcriptional regulator